MIPGLSIDNLSAMNVGFQACESSVQKAPAIRRRWVDFGQRLVWQCRLDTLAQELQHFTTLSPASGDDYVVYHIQVPATVTNVTLFLNLRSKTGNILLLNKGGVSSCIETPPAYVGNNLRVRSKHPSILGGCRFLIIRSAVQKTLPMPANTFIPRSR
jgi:hypothetical protein